MIGPRPSSETTFRLQDLLTANRCTWADLAHVSHYFLREMGLPAEGSMTPSELRETFLEICRRPIPVQAGHPTVSSFLSVAENHCNLLWFFNVLLDPEVIQRVNEASQTSNADRGPLPLTPSYHGNRPGLDWDQGGRSISEEAARIAWEASHARWEGNNTVHPPITHYEWQHGIRTDPLARATPVASRTLDPTVQLGGIPEGGGSAAVVRP